MVRGLTDWKESAMKQGMRRAAPYTLVSAVQGDRVPGVEISDPDCPVAWADVPPDAKAWAEAQGYGTDESQLLYVLESVDETPIGFRSYYVYGPLRPDSC